MRDCCPPILLMLVRKFRNNNNTFTGNYATWAEAEMHASGYDSDAIFHHVREAALKVKNGEAVFERDSVCFYKEDYRWPALACLLSIAAEKGGKLNVLDFGGSLGSFYIQHQKFFNRLKAIRWSVIEQAHIVECGRNEFQNEELRFYSNIEECVANEKVDVVFLSSVLQYLESPHEMLTMLTKTKAPYFLIDRTPIVVGEGNRLAIQHVPKNIFPSTLPANIFSERDIDVTMAKSNYVRKVSLPCKEGRQGNIDFVGILYCKESK